MNYPVRLLLLAACALCALPASARPPVPVAPTPPGHRLVFDTRKFMRVSELRPGMRGYALTVFKGTRIDKFHIEILGVIAKFNEGKDYILFRALDGPPVTRHLNIAHGMSGSPIYINGRLVGAISMGIPGTQFPKDPIALATPIEDMFDSWSPDLPSKVTSIGASADTGGSAISLSAGGLNAAGANIAAGGNFQQLDLPVAVSGMGGRSLARLQTALAPYHFALFAGGGSGADENNPLAKGAKLVPGAAVGISLVQGDMDLTATGTVTYRDGNRVLLFGHPFTDFGPIDAAMTTAYVVDIFPSYQDSIKLGSPIKTVGRVFQDRPFSVGAVIGSLPQMVPVTIDVNDLSIKRRKVFHMTVINHPLLTGQLIPELADAAIAQVHGQPGDSIAQVSMDADVEEIGHVKRTNTFFDPVSIDQSAIGDLNDLMTLLSSNPFYPLAVRSLKMTVTLQNRHDTAEVDHIFVRQGKYAPGDTVNVGVVLKPYKRDPITRTIALQIPQTAPDGTLTLSVKGGGDSGGGLSLGGGLILLRPSDPLPPAGNIRQLVKTYAEKPRNTELVARLILPTVAINIKGEKLTLLPPTMASVMQSSRTSGLKTERDEVKVVQPVPYIVSGTQSLTLTVQKKDTGDGDTAASTSSPAASGSSDTGASSDGASSSSSDGGDGGSPSSLKDTPDDTLSEEPLPAIGMATLPLTGEGKKAASLPSPVRGRVASLSEPGGVPAPGAASSAAPASPTPAVKTVGRLASVWRQSSMNDFSAGTLTNVSVTSMGDVRLSAPLARDGETGESYVWSLLPDGQGHVYAGTGDRGIVYKVGADGKPAVFFRTGQLEVNALARDAVGNVYAGTSPHGIVYKIAPGGKGSPFFTADEKYVTALAVDDARGRLYAATGGGSGRVYQLPLAGAAPGAKPWFQSPEAHILALAQDKYGNVYAGASPDGIVYKITPDGTARVLFDAPEPSIASLAVDGTGTVYAGTAPKGTIYKIATDGTSKALFDRAASGVLALQTDGGDNLYACAGNTVYRISPDETVQSFTAATDEQFLSLAADKTGGQVYAGTAALGALYRIGAANGAQDAGGLSGQYVSAVHDAGLSARWGTLAWSADTPPGTRITLQTRTGDTARPDASWSAWSPAYSSPSGQPMQSPPGRYAQYQAAFTSDAGAAGRGDAPRLRDVTLYYLPRNQPPSIRLLSPRGGEAVSKTVSIRWAASDPDKDTLSYDLSYSADGGATWKPLANAAPAAPTPAATMATAKAAAAPTTSGPAPVTDAEVAAKVQQMKAELDKHTEMPAAVRQQILAQAPAVIRQGLTEQRAQAVPGTGDTGSVKSTTFTWDTTTLPDGVYRLQVIASDAPSNPQGALTAKAQSATFLVANQAPALTLGVPVVASDKTVTLHGAAKTGAAFVKAVQGRADTGDMKAALADDGLFDSPSEGFTLTLGPLASGTHALEVQAVDQAGNLTTGKATVVVP